MNPRPAAALLIGVLRARLPELSAPLADLPNPALLQGMPGRPGAEPSNRADGAGYNKQSRKRRSTLPRASRRWSLFRRILNVLGPLVTAKLRGVLPIMAPHDVRILASLRAPERAAKRRLGDLPAAPTSHRPSEAIQAPTRAHSASSSDTI